METWKIGSTFVWKQVCSPSPSPNSYCAKSKSQCRFMYLKKRTTDPTKFNYFVILRLVWCDRSSSPSSIITNMPTHTLIHSLHPRRADKKHLFYFWPTMLGVILLCFTISDDINFWKTRAGIHNSSTHWFIFHYKPYALKLILFKKSFEI